MHLHSLSGRMRHRFFRTIFFAVENTLSAGAVEAGMDKYFLASLAMVGKHDS